MQVKLWKVKEAAMGLAIDYKERDHKCIERIAGREIKGIG